VISSRGSVTKWSFSPFFIFLDSFFLLPRRIKISLLL
jgi:hypothetical protein